MDSAEQKWIEHYDSYYNGYNCNLGGNSCGHEQLEKIVYCYDFEGNNLHVSFKSVRETSRQLQIDQTLVFNICNGTRNKKSATSKTDGKVYRFSYDNLERLPPLIYKRNSKQIKQFSMDGDYIKTWNSVADIVETYVGNRRSTALTKKWVGNRAIAFGYI